MNAQTNIRAADRQSYALLTYGDDGHAIPAWPHEPSRTDWQVMFYGGRYPSGHERLPEVFQFSTASHTWLGVLHRGNSAALMRECRFAVRDPDGVVVFNGPAMDALGNPCAVVGRAA